MAMGDERSRVALLLRRAGFGSTPEELDRYAKQGLDATIDELLHPERASESFDELLGTLNGHLLDLQFLEDVQTWWLYRMVRTKRPLLEKLTLFWHGHFAVGNAKVQNPLFMHQHLDLLRTHGLGSYRDMLYAVSKDPAMLVWLDNATNRKVAPNENYGRELLELYTLGIGPYSEADVQAAARAFTGWNLRGTEFVFDRNQHDFGSKTFMGKTGALDGGDIIDAVVGREETARRICGKLFSYFAYPRPEAAVLQPLVTVYLKQDQRIGPVLEALFRSDAFYSEESRYGHVKSPVEYTVGAIRSLGAQVRERALVAALRSMGQDILNPPNVAGWRGGAGWVNPSTLLERFNFAARLATSRGEPNDGGQVKVSELLGVPAGDLNGERVADRLVELLGGLELAPEARQALVSYVQAPLVFPQYVTAAPNPQQVQMAREARLRGALHLALVSPDYLVG
ncbi:MAG: DUF1800 domain-containing protein [Chloroflexota bacterium]